MLIELIEDYMAITKKKVAAAVSAAKAPVKKAESVSDLDSLFVKPSSTPSSTNSSTSAKKNDLGTINYLGKDRKLRRAAITWDEQYEGKDMLFCIYFDADCFSCIGNIADGIALRKQYPLEQGWFINDQLMNKVHKFTIYKIHIHEIVDHVE